MNKLDEYRLEIDEIDEKIVKLFEKRMETVLKVANYKKENNMEILQVDRENIVLDKAINNLNNKEYSDDIKEVFKLIMKLSKNKQNEKLNL
ncbi:chorismate mutase [Peptacetobacter sp.]|uniref:chorismate mutase n=1 Tax=Peptacetobacter sp. TaxID=2991975 RepID=UPI00261056D7|nr:chorismate mutase [Peptacetobacter sp.]